MCAYDIFGNPLMSRVFNGGFFGIFLTRVRNIEY